MKERITITVDKDVYDWIIEKSEKERLSVSALINRLALYAKRDEALLPRPDKAMKSVITKRN